MQTKFLFLRYATQICLYLGILMLQLSAKGQGTAFTYQGRLATSGQPANGSYDFTFGLYDSASNGIAIANSVTNSATQVTNGLFSAVLDFGPGAFNGPRWLQLSV